MRLLPSFVGAIISIIGFILLSYTQDFWQFAAVRVGILAFGHALACYFVVNVTISRWFVRQRGRALAIAHLGEGLSKVTISLVVASLIVVIGWRQVWTLFGGLVLFLVLIPAALWMRRSPEDMGLYPDGAAGPYEIGKQESATQRSAAPETSDITWSRREALRTSTFWLIVSIFSIVDVGITGLNLHVVAYVSDKDYSTVLAASVMTVIAATQLGSALLWGFVSERVSARKAVSVMFIIQAAGLIIAMQANDLSLLYVGFFLYGAGLGGAQVLQEIMWANYFGRISLGTVRGMSLPVILISASLGPPFFGYLYDYTGSYDLSLTLFIAVQILCAGLTLLIRRPVKSSPSSCVPVL